MKEIIDAIVRKYILPKYGSIIDYEISVKRHYEFDTFTVRFKVIWRFEHEKSLENEMFAIMKSIGFSKAISSINQNPEGKKIISIIGHEYHP